MLESSGREVHEEVKEMLEREINDDENQQGLLPGPLDDLLDEGRVDESRVEQSILRMREAWEHKILETQA